jgi:hypothetical protein
MRARDDYPLFGALRDAYIDGHDDIIGREASRVLRELDDLRDRLAATDISPWSFIVDGDLDYANGEAHDYAVDCGTAWWCAGCLSMPASYWTRDTNAGDWPHIHRAPNGLQLHIRRVDDTFNVIRRPFCPRRYTEAQPLPAGHSFEQQSGSNMCVCGEPDTSHSPTLRLIENYDKHPVRFQAVCTRCGWHWPQGGYVTESTARSVYGQHDCRMHTSAAIPLSALGAVMDQTVVDE